MSARVLAVITPDAPWGIPVLGGRMRACSWASCGNCGRCTEAWERADEEPEGICVTCGGACEMDEHFCSDECKEIYYRQPIDGEALESRS